MLGALPDDVLMQICACGGVVYRTQGDGLGGSASTVCRTFVYTPAYVGARTVAVTPRINVRESAVRLDAVGVQAAVWAHRALGHATMSAKYLELLAVMPADQVHAACTWSGRRPLHDAVARGMGSCVVKKLVAMGADVDAEDGDGTTPLEHAIHSTLWSTIQSRVLWCMCGVMFIHVWVGYFISAKN